MQERDCVRGAEETHSHLHSMIPLFFPNPEQPKLISLDDALTGLSKRDPLKSRIVEMKFFAGLNFEEIAGVEKVSPARSNASGKKRKSKSLRNTRKGAHEACLRRLTNVCVVADKASTTGYCVELAPFPGWK
jgi:ECF sigma factor